MPEIYLIHNDTVWTSTLTVCNSNMILGNFTCFQFVGLPVRADTGGAEAAGGTFCAPGALVRGMDDGVYGGGG